MKNTYFITSSFIILFSINSNSQSLWSAFWKLPCAEKKWVIFHPFIAKNVFFLSQEALITAQSLINDTSLDGDMNGGQLDAFKHAFWMALVCKKYGAKKAFSLGKAHEKGNYQLFKKNKLEDGVLPDFESSQMDYLNNDVGIEICKTYHFANSEELKTIIIDLIKQGKLYILKKDQMGKFIYCDSANIRSDKKIWITGKCIVKSNTKRE